MRLDALVRSLRAALLVFLAALTLLLGTRRESVSGDLGSWLAPGERTVAVATAVDGPQTAAVEAVPFGGRLVASVPRDFDRWRWATDGEMTLLVHALRGEIDTVLWIEVVRSSEWPSLELDRFHHEVVPFLGRRAVSVGVIQGEHLPNLLIEETGLDRGAVHGALTRLRGRTLGRGLGFRASSRQFPGWRVMTVGALELRLTRLEGHWGSPGTVDPDLRTVIAELAELSPLLADLDRELDREEVGGETRDRGSAAAQLVLGEVRLGPGNALHLAVLCRLEPRCHAAGDLVTILQSLRRPEAGEVDSLARTAGPPRLQQLARELGWSLRLGEQRLDVEDLRRLDRWLGEQKAANPSGGS